MLAGSCVASFHAFIKQLLSCSAKLQLLKPKDKLQPLASFFFTAKEEMLLYQNLKI